MPKSFGKSQATKATNNLLNKLGANKDEFVLVNTSEGFIKIAANLLTNASNNLRKSNSVASGTLESTMSMTEPTVEGKKISIGIMLQDYWKFVDGGVKGVERGSGKYQFKTKFASKKMAKAIEGWLTHARSSTSNVKVSYKKTERKRKSITTLPNKKSISYAVATSIKKKGIKPTNFMAKAILKAMQEGKSLGLNLKTDIKDGISNK